MDIKILLSILWGNKWVILTTVFVTVVAVVSITLLITPTYTATTTLRIATSSNGSVTYSDYLYADRLTNTYVKIATSSPVLTELEAKLGINQPPQIKVVTIPNTELIQLSVDSSNPVLAQEAANTLADILVSQGKKLYSGEGKSQQEILSDQLAQAETELNQARQDYESLVSRDPENTEQIAAANQTIDLREKTYTTLLGQYEQARMSEALRANTITIVEPAVKPLSPSQPRKVINISLGVIMGLVGGIGLVFLFENLNPRLYTTKQIESSTGLPLLSKIPNAERKDLLLAKDSKRPPEGPFQEAIRRLRSNVLTWDLNGSSCTPPKTLLVVSAQPDEGKSTIAAHLALSMARSGQKILLVDADMRLPTLHKVLDLPNKQGLSTILIKQANFEDVVQVDRYLGLHVITSGPVPSYPAELLGSSRMKALMDELTKQYDIVLYDAPAFLQVTDASLLAPLVDRVMLIVRRIAIHQEAIREVCNQLEDKKIQSIGLVVNRAEHIGGYYYYYK